MHVSWLAALLQMLTADHGPSLHLMRRSDLCLHYLLQGLGVKVFQVALFRGIQAEAD